ncbi:uncharacterized protein LOC133171660 [Saccostrea echinata]|uniref:uncharacterized protein LOC133171660 n=1 Tax=Saccostrea echinata TaxID=191078 RepID=UPI002A7EBA22|nr:uncharacterized protein LOC133171660 [Saccostrea echinata]
MAYFVFSWKKRDYIMTVLSLIMLVLTVKHQEFFLCREVSLNRIERFALWLGVLEEPKPCPGIEDLHTMVMEMGVSTLAVLASTAAPKLLNWTKSVICHAVQAMKDSIRYIKDRIFPRKFELNATPQKSESKLPREKFIQESAPKALEEDRPKYKYYFFRKAYEMKRIILFIKKGERCEEVFAYSPKTKKFVLKSFYPKQPRY